MTACITSFSGYSGNLHAYGDVMVSYFGTETIYTKSYLEFDMTGLESNCTDCKLAIHEGKSCETEMDIGGEFWNSLTVLDPWLTAHVGKYNSNQNGRAMGAFSLDNGYTKSENLGRAVIFYAQDNITKIGCGLLQSEYEGVCDWIIPESTGEKGMSEEKTVTVTQRAGHMSNNSKDSRSSAPHSPTHSGTSSPSSSKSSKSGSSGPSSPTHSGTSPPSTSKSSKSGSKGSSPTHSGTSPPSTSKSSKSGSKGSSPTHSGSSPPSSSKSSKSSKSYSKGTSPTHSGSSPPSSSKSGKSPKSGGSSGSSPTDSGDSRNYGKSDKDSSGNSYRRSGTGSEQYHSYRMKSSKSSRSRPY